MNGKGGCREEKSDREWTQMGFSQPCPIVRQHHASLRLTLTAPPTSRPIFFFTLCDPLCLLVQVSVLDVVDANNCTSASVLYGRVVVLTVIRDHVAETVGTATDHNDRSVECLSKLPVET